MPNPIGPDTGNETTELYNCGDEPVNIGGWVLKNEDGNTYEIPAGTTIDAHGYYLTTAVQLDNSGGQVFLYHDGEEVDRSITYTHSTEGKSWQRRTDGLDTDNDGDWNLGAIRRSGACVEARPVVGANPVESHLVGT